MRTVLIVDDSKVVRIVVRRMVESLGFATAEATSGEEAVAYLNANEPPDAVLLDIVMPAMDGMACLRAIRQDLRFERCPVIMCSSQNSPDEIADAVAAGANEYVMKPFSEDILADKFRQVGLIE
jgi:two-component system chemotaxis response regulator CheY